MEFWPLAMIAVCLSFVALNEAEQVSLTLAMDESEVRKLQKKERSSCIGGCSAGPDGKVRLTGPQLSI